jgi:branched-subunit amino acid transport protein
MSDSSIWTVIVAMAIANFAVRFVPMAVVSRMELPRPVMRWLSYIPISVMGAIVADALLRPEAEFVSPLSNPYLIAAIPTALVYYKTRSFLGAVVVGMIVFVALRGLLGIG